MLKCPISQNFEINVYRSLYVQCCAGCLLLATLNVLKSRWIGVKLQCTSSNFLLPQTDQSINYLCIYRSIFHLFYFHPFLPSLSADILLQARAIHLGNCILYYIIIIIMCYIFSLFSRAGQYGPGWVNKVSNECYS